MILAACGTLISKVDVIGLGLDFKTAANNTASVAAYFGKDNDHSTNKTRTSIISDEYAMSKRTTLYGALVFADAKAGATLLTTVVAGGMPADKNTSLPNVGIRHSF